MKILSPSQIRELDQYSIQHEPISSIDLMERAANACALRIEALNTEHKNIHVYCGKGNNGGDGFAIARLLLEKKMNVQVIFNGKPAEFSNDAAINYKRLDEKFKSALLEIQHTSDLDEITSTSAIAIDALLGTGLNKPVEGLLAELISFINNRYQQIISIDMPSGLYADQSSVNLKHIVKCNLCLSFQMPKLAFMMPNNEKYVPEFEILDIGLDEKKHAAFSCHHFYVTINDIRSLIKPRTKFSHKGTYGHALLMAGSKGKSGAALMAAKACLRSGAGLLTLHSTKDTIQALHQYLPEAMSINDTNENYITEIDAPENYEALAFGPGTGSSEETAQVLKKIFNYYKGSMVIDADGLNVLSDNKTWLHFIPANTILTPHLKEFERLTEKTTDDFERLNLLKQFSVKYNCIVVLKGAHSCIAMPDSNVFFNSSGNPGLAKGGSGDVLTGIILGLLSRGYSEAQASLIGTFVHGLAADLCAQNMSTESILASDLIEKLPQAFKLIE